MQALHGDIAQAARERTLQRFRDGKTLVLVATDVAARGLDIPNVDLVVHYELPHVRDTSLHSNDAMEDLCSYCTSRKAKLHLNLNLVFGTQEVESFLHRSGRTGRAGRPGTAIAMYMSKEYHYFRKVLHETKVDNCEIIAPPAPRAVMEAAAKAVRAHEDFLHQLSCPWW